MQEGTTKVESGTPSVSDIPVDLTNKQDSLSCPIHDVDTFDAGFLQDPYPFYARTRKEAPVYRDANTGVVYVATYELIREVSRRPDVFSNQFAEFLSGGGTNKLTDEERAIKAEGVAQVDTMLTADPPRHTRYKKIAMSAFTTRRAEEMSGFVEELCHELIDGMPEGGCEFKQHFANRLPMYVISEVLGVPRSKFDQFEQWTDAFILQLSGLANEEQRLWAARTILDCQRYFLEVIAHKRQFPADDVISDLVNADITDEDPPRKMNDEELISILQQLLVAGNETTAHTLTAGLNYLLQRPDTLAKLKADPGLAGNFVEETLRFLTPTNNMWRVVKSDHQIGGVDVSAGDLVLLRYGSANRDEEQFEAPDDFDIERDNIRRHMAFGSGIHHCLGSQLARKEMTLAFPIILQRLSQLELDESNGSLRYLPSVLLRGVENLHISYQKQPRRNL
ncbi:MAG: cytochrome P450 [Pseudomonadota bacterium]